MINAGLFPALETLLAVARTGSVGAAARQRHITASAVSQQIRRLESHLDVKLLERVGRGVRLTAAGEAALPVVRELWSGAESAFEQLAGLAEDEIPELAERSGLPESKLRNGGWQEGARHRLTERNA